jgi:hypothetical protein|tara:strand:+ start:70 stop:663 length:594 start_codon:yes stop_codon:yes gene_type:complete
MALSEAKLRKELKKAFKKARELNNDKPKYSKASIAQFIADAIANYAGDAEIQISVPSTILSTVPATVGTPDAASSGQRLKVVDTQSGKGPLAATINFSFTAMDIGMVAVTPVIVAYAATLMNFKNLPGTITATGASIMAIPPVLAPAFAIGAAGGSEDNVIRTMATIIHTSFKSTLFTGIGNNIAPPATGPVVGTLM